MPIALVASVSAGSSTSHNVTTGAINTTGANLIVVFVASYVVGIDYTFADSKSNGPAIESGTGQAATDALGSLWYWHNPTVGSGHTFTINSNSDYPSLCVMAFSGVKLTSPHDQLNKSGGASGTSRQPGSVTPTEDNELLVTGLGHEGASSISIGSSFTIATFVAYVSGQHFGGAIAYKIQTTAGAENPTWSWTTSTENVAKIATFKAEPGAAADVSLVMPSTGFRHLLVR